MMKSERSAIASAEECHQILTEMIRACAHEFLDEDNLSLPPRYAHAVQELNVQILANGEKKIKIKPYDKMRAMQMLATWLGWVVPEADEGETFTVQFVQDDRAAGRGEEG